MDRRYSPKTIEPKWQAQWEKYGNSQSENGKKYYILDMFPYPSGDGLHAGHVENYTATDILARYMRMRGFDVMHPIGWDAFGLPAENFAIKTGTHPDEKTHQNIRNFVRQIKSLGISYDWDREIDTSSPEYYRWTQWMFLHLYEHGLAYRKKAHVNWCESCQTVLANEQAENGICERCKNTVIQKELEQWFFRITDFVEDSVAEDGGKVSGLLSGLEKIDWPESTKAAQRNWIGRSEGTIVQFPISNFQFPNKSQNSISKSEYIEVFTTRVDTIFGCTYVVVAPEHRIIADCRSRIANFNEVEEYLEQTKKRSDIERTELNKEKTGVKLEGIETINPFTGEAVPVFVADYVLGSYGTGAVMAVPAHDTRDREFASKYQLPIKTSVLPSKRENQKGDTEPRGVREVFTEDGMLVNSGEFTDLSSAKAREKMAAWLEEKGLGGKTIKYKLRDWLISRQRYWGAPIPIISCDACGTVPVPESDLPVLLPTDVDFRPTGESPLVRSKSFHDVKCPKCGKPARRESDTMDTFVCSSWYYLRFADPNNKERFADSEKLEKFLPVDFYMGGAEHSVLHLLYARFLTKTLAKYGEIGFDEPFVKLRHQGMVLAEDGRKMSKSLGNVVNPDEIVGDFGADTLRLYEMFMGPLEDMKAWNTGSIIGSRRFLDKVWKLHQKTVDSQQSAENKKLESLLHQTIKKVTEDIENLRYNTAISALMILANAMEKEISLPLTMYRTSLVLLSPFAPHIAEELWHDLGNEKSIFLESWPEYDSEKIVDDTVTIAVSVNGKVRDTITVPRDISEEESRAMALASEKVRKYTEGKEPKKVIVVPGRIVNIVI
jgi:leucyl-tRNA synthetase